MSRRNDKVSEINKNIGAKIFNLRISRGLSRARMAPYIHVTMQQLQKYEIGANVISAARLLLLSLELNVPITYFYDNFDDINIIKDKQTLSLWVSRNFSKITNDKTKEAINKLIVSLADDENNKEGSND